MNILLLNGIRYRNYMAPDGPVLSPAEHAVHVITHKRFAAGIPDSDYHALHAVSDWIDDDCIAVARRWHKARPLQCVATVSEDRVLTAARIRDELDIPGMRTEQALGFRDKVVMKERVAAHGIPVPAFAALLSEDQAAAFVARHGRSVIKPRRGSGSEETFIIDSPEQAAAVTARLGDTVARFEIEGFVEGPMFHCDSVVVDGQVVLASVSAYQTPTTAFATEDALVSVMEGESETARRIKVVNQRVTDALGLRNGVGHLEVFVTPDGEIVFCEMACRPGGAGVVPAVDAAFGVNLLHTVLRLETGRPVSVPNQAHQLAAWVTFYRKPGTVLSANSLEDFPEDWITHRRIYVGEGDVLGQAEHSTDAAAQFVLTGGDRDQLTRRIASVRERWSMRVRDEG